MHFSFIECKPYCRDAQHLNLNDTKSQPLLFTLDANDFSRLFLFICLKFVFIHETYSVYFKSLAEIQHFRSRDKLILKVSGMESLVKICRNL